MGSLDNSQDVLGTLEIVSSFLPISGPIEEREMLIVSRSKSRPKN